MFLSYCVAIALIADGSLMAYAESPLDESSGRNEPSAEQELEQQAHDLAEQDRQERGHHEPKVWFMALTTAEAESVKIEDIPRTIFSGSELQKKIKKYSDIAEKVTMRGAETLEMVFLNSVYEGFRGPLSPISDWLKNRATQTGLFRDPWVGYVGAVPPATAYTVANMMLRFIVHPVYVLAAKSGVRKYHYKKNGITHEDVVKARRLIRNRAHAVCRAAGASGALMTQKSLTILAEKISPEEFKSGQVRVFLNDHFLTDEEFMASYEKPFHVFASLHCEAKPFELNPSFFPNSAEPLVEKE